jgi:hypothetical protein
MTVVLSLFCLSCVNQFAQLYQALLDKVSSLSRSSSPSPPPLLLRLMGGWSQDKIEGEMNKPKRERGLTFLDY